MPQATPFAQLATPMDPPFSGQGPRESTLTFFSSQTSNTETLPPRGQGPTLGHRQASPAPLTNKQGSVSQETDIYYKRSSEGGSLQREESGLNELEMTSFHDEGSIVRTNGEVSQHGRLSDHQPGTTAASLLPSSTVNPLRSPCESKSGLSKGTRGSSTMNSEATTPTRGRTSGSVSPITAVLNTSMGASTGVPRRKQRGAEVSFSETPGLEESHGPGLMRWSTHQRMSGRQPDSSIGTNNTFDSSIVPTSCEEEDFLLEGQASSRSCRAPLNLAVMGNIIMTVALVAVLTIVPLNNVSLRSIDHVMTSLSTTVASTLTQSLDSNLIVLPTTLKTFAVSFLRSNTVTAWDFVEVDAPVFMSSMCEIVALPQGTSSLLYMSLTSPYSGWSAYCSAQYPNNHLIGNFIMWNESAPRYYINRTTFSYHEPFIPFEMVNSMTPWEYSVEFCEENNPWTHVVKPWYEYLHVKGDSVEGGELVAKYPFLATIELGHVLEGYWYVMTDMNMSIITYTIPFIDNAGYPAMLTAALQPEGIYNLIPQSMLSMPEDGRTMVLDAMSGIVLTNSWGQSCQVMFDSWNEDCVCSEEARASKGLYLSEIDDPLMRKAVERMGGQAGLAARPRSVKQWMGTFPFERTEALVIVSRVSVGTKSETMNLLVVYTLRRDEYTSSVATVQRATTGSVVAILIFLVLVDMALLHLLLRPLQGVAKGLRDAAQLRDGRESVDGYLSFIKEVADMQINFRMMNDQLMRMKAFLPQGVLGPTTGWTGSDGRSDYDGSLTESVADSEDGSTTAARHRVFDDGDEDNQRYEPEMIDGAKWRGGVRAADGTDLRLNEKVLLGDLNHFRRRYCTVMVFAMHVQESELGTKFLDRHCAEFMDAVLPCVLRYGGIIELQRPDFITVSFGAHNKVALHQSRAAKCALETMHILNTTTPLGPRVGCLLDVGEYFVGTCGAAHRNALVTYGYELPTKIDLVKLLKSLHLQIILTQRLAYTLDDTMIVIPVDRIVLNSIGSVVSILYELRGHVRMLPPEVTEVSMRATVKALRTAFNRMIKGDFPDALQTLTPFIDSEIQAARLAHLCRCYVNRRITQPLCRNISRLRFKETDFVGYIEVIEDGPSLSMTGGAQSGASASLGNNASTFPFSGHASTSQGIASFQSFRMSPYPPELDVQQIITRAPSMRLTTAEPPANGASVESTSLFLNQDHQPGSPLVVVDGSELTFGPVSGAGKVASENAQSTVDGESKAGEEEEEEDALFEMFGMGSEASSDDGDGAGEGDKGGETGGIRVGKADLPLFFQDYEGNSWRRSYDQIGSGAFANVFRGLSESGDLVALKCFTLRARNVDMNMIAEEVRLFASLHHENVVQYLSVYVSDYYLIEIMEFLPGGSLDTLLTSFGVLREESVRRYLRDVVRGLLYLHEQNIVHCDIKPHNVLLAMDGQCKLSDFGSAIARATSSVCKIDDVLDMRGTPGYMAPEVARGEVPTMKSDIYSLGVTILELLTGKLPWDYLDAEVSVPLTPINSTEEIRRRASRHPSLSNRPSLTLSAGSNTSDLKKLPSLSRTHILPNSPPSRKSSETGSHAASSYADPLTPCTRSGAAKSPRAFVAEKPAEGAGSSRSTNRRSIPAESMVPDIAPTLLQEMGKENAGSPTSSTSLTSSQQEATRAMLRRPSQGLSPASRRPIEQVIRNSTQLIIAISRGNVVPRIPETLGDDLADFLSLCLHPDPEERPSMQELAQHPWLM